MTGDLKREPPFLLMLVCMLVPVIQFCTPESCYEDTVSQVKAGFYQTGTGANIVADTVSLYGLEMALSPIHNKSKDLMGVNFPLDPSTASCSFIFIINGITDTVTFHYSSFPHLISKECGYSMFHTLESYTSTRHLIDTIILRNRNITIPNEENISIFF
ncbi:MAG: DUF6452 family protein [Bacteroidales bacterium]